jgi:hypothetical protein
MQEPACTFIHPCLILIYLLPTSEFGLLSFRLSTDARRVNSVLKIYGSYLIDATSTHVYRVQPAGCADTGYTNTCATGEQDCPTGEQPNSDLSAAGGCVVNATDVSVFPTRPGNGLLIGQFQLADGRTGAHHTVLPM